MKANEIILAKQQEEMMKRSRFIKLLVILSILLLALGAATTALAGKPVHDQEVWEADWVDTEICPGVELDAHLEVISNHFFWFDRFGEYHSESYHGVARGSLSHEGRIVRMRSNENFTSTLLSFENGIAQLYNTVTGTYWLGNVPGHGVVAGSAGRETFYETCVLVDPTPGNEVWDCTAFGYERSGMVFDQPGVVCQYLVAGN